MFRGMIVFLLLLVGIGGGVVAALDRDTDPLSGERESTWERLERAVDDGGF